MTRFALVPALSCLALLTGCMGSRLAPEPCNKTEELRAKIAQASGTARELLLQEYDEANRRCQDEMAGYNHHVKPYKTPEERARAVRDEAANPH